MIRLTRGLFVLVLKTLGVDCVCDVGSRDGDESLFFRNLLLDAVVLAFEANPINYQIMAARVELGENHIEVFLYAISDRNGRAKFYVTDVDLQTQRRTRQYGSNTRFRLPRICKR